MGKADFKKTNKPQNDGACTGKSLSKRVAPKRSNHKHLYEDVLITNYILSNGETWNHLMLGKRCTVCGKVAVKKYMLTKKNERDWYEVMSDEEIIHDERYCSLPIVDAEREGLKCL